jgi:hypothetical protein
MPKTGGWTDLGGLCKAPRDMEFFLGRSFYLMGYEIGYIMLLVASEVTANSGPNRTNPPASDSLKLQVKERLGSMEELCDSINLKLAAQQVSRFAYMLEGTVTPQRIATEARHLYDLISDQMKEKLFLFVPDHQVTFLKQNAFSKKVSTEFPSTAFEIAQAGRCYAAGCWTACVFHLMRTLEVGLAALGKVFGISLAYTNWGPAIDQIESKIRNMGQDPIWKARSGWKEEQQFYSQVVSFLAVAKDAWRNYTAHGNSQYTEGQAALMCLNVKAFLEKAAERLHE